MSENNKENKDTSKKIARETKNGKESRLIVSVTGISCSTCAVAIEKQVKKIEGVNDVKTAIMLNKVFIDYDPTLTDSATIRKAIDKTGYKSYMSVE